MSKTALVKEDVTRRMMKLANIGAINTDNFINETYEELEEAHCPGDKMEEGEHELEEEVQEEQEEGG